MLQWLIILLTKWLILKLWFIRWESEQLQGRNKLQSLRCLKVGVRLNLINHFVSFIPCQFTCNSAFRNPVFRWDSCMDTVWESVKKVQKCALSRASLFRANLLVIQYLETLYLGGIHIRVVCERVWRKAQKCALSRASWLDLAVGKSPKEAHVWSMQGSWRVKPVGALQDKTSSLVRQLARGLDSLLSKVVRPSCQTTLFVT